MKKIKPLLLLFSYLFSQAALTSDFDALSKEVKKSKKSIIKEYWKHHKNFTRKACRPGTEEEFWKKFRNFRGDGHYLPRNVEGGLDGKTLNRFVPELQKKQKWIQSQRDSLKKIESFKSLLETLKKLEEDVKYLVSLKEKYEEAESDSVKISLKNKSKYKLILFKKEFSDFLKKVPFLTSYRFPVDHFELRENYDEVKESNNEKEKRRANEVYFYRKVVQDGAQNPNRSHSDTFLRAMLDTLSLSMKDSPEFIPEDLRYDLNSAFYGLEKQLKRGPGGQARRFEEWNERVGRMLDFYNSLKKNKVKVGTHFETGDQIVKTQAKARKELKEFVFNKHKEVFNYWADKDEVYRAIYVITTTLFNEVGSIDGHHALERKDVTQVVLNRVHNPKYNFIPETDFLYPYFVEGRTKEALSKYSWLNVMFKEGEFSYTYYFIHGAVRVFCPDMTRVGRRLRERNLKIALERLENPNGPFKGLRYFSRASMLGRISMDKIWKDYRPISERAGVRLKNGEAALFKKYKAGDYAYRYHFYDDIGRRFKVIEIDDTVYALEVSSNHLYTYRNPHYFKYFEPN